MQTHSLKLQILMRNTKNMSAKETEKPPTTCSGWLASHIISSLVLIRIINKWRQRNREKWEIIFLKFTTLPIYTWHFTSVMPFQRPHRLIFKSNFSTPSNNASFFSNFLIFIFFSCILFHLNLLFIFNRTHNSSGGLMCQPSRRWMESSWNDFSCSFLIAHPVYSKFFAFWQQMLPASCIF